MRRGSPLPIPNREVKPDCADGTAVMWESMSPPFLVESLSEKTGFLVFNRSGAVVDWCASPVRAKPSGRRSAYRQAGGRNYRVVRMAGAMVLRKEMVPLLNLKNLLKIVAQLSHSATQKLSYFVKQKLTY